MPSLHQGDVLEEEVEEEEWSDAGRHPPRHFPAANVIRPNHIHAVYHQGCCGVLKKFQDTDFTNFPY